MNSLVIRVASQIVKEKQTSGDSAVTQRHMRKKSAENSDPKVWTEYNFHHVSSPHLVLHHGSVQIWEDSISCQASPFSLSTKGSSELSGANLFFWKAVKCYKASAKQEPTVTVICETLCI